MSTVTKILHTLTGQAFSQQGLVTY